MRTIGDIGDIPTGLPFPTSPPLSLLSQVRPRQEQLKDRRFDSKYADIRIAVSQNVVLVCACQVLPECLPIAVVAFSIGQVRIRS